MLSNYRILKISKKFLIIHDCGCKKPAKLFIGTKPQSFNKLMRRIRTISGWEKFRLPTAESNANSRKTEIQEALAILGVKIFSPHLVHGINFKWD